MLELRNLSKRYGHVIAVDGVNLTVQKGEFFCLLGSSGCGKTTILRMVAGFERKTSGSILLNGQEIGDVPPYKRDVNTVFQSYALFPHMNVITNIGYGLRVHGVSPPEIEKRAAEALELVGLQTLGDRMPSELSGGQQQRVALARALVNRPSVLLLDEPLSALDKKIAEQTRLELAALQRNVGITFVYVTHNQTEALSLADRIAVMHDGRIEQCDTPGMVYEKPKTRFVADFIGSMNFLDAEVLSSSSSDCKLRLWNSWEVEVHKNTPFTPGDRALFCVRPEQLKLSLFEPKDFENGIKGRLAHKVYEGGQTIYHLDLGDGHNLRVSHDNYLAHMAREFFDLDETYYILWSKTSGEVLHV